MGTAKESFKYTGIALIEITLNASQEQQDFPATSVVSHKNIVAIEFYGSSAMLPSGALPIGTTDANAPKNTYINILDKNKRQIIQDYPLALMEKRQDRGAGGPLLFVDAPIQVSFPDCTIKVKNPSTYIATGEKVALYFYYND